MIGRALAALALGGLFLIILLAFHSPVEAARQPAPAPEIIERYRQALATDPGNLTLHYLLGVSLLRNDLNAEALSELTAAYPAYQNSMEANYNLAVAALRLEDLVSTEIYLDQAIDLGADNMQGVYPLATLYFNMALASQSNGDHNEAIRYFHRALDFAPGRYEIYRQLGDLYAQQGNIELAIKAFHTYLEEFPDDPVSRDYLFALEFNRAQDYLAIGDFRNAEIGFKAALDLQPGSPTALYYLGYLAYSSQQPFEAVSYLGDAFNSADLELQRTIRPLLYNTALALWESGRIIKALAAVSNLADQEHALFNELFLASTLSMKTNQYRDAHGYLLRALELNPDDAAARQNLIAAEEGAFREWLAEIRLGIEKDNLLEAENALQMAERLQPHSTKLAGLKTRLAQEKLNKASALFFNAQVALSSGDLSTALAHVNSGLEIEPIDRDGLALRNEIRQAMTIDLGQLYKQGREELQAGNLGSADQAFEKILAISPKHAEALAGKKQIARARAEHALKLQNEGQRAIDNGQAEIAIQAFNQLLAMAPENESARQGLNSARQMQANRINELIHKSRQAADRAQFDKARQWLVQAEAIDDSGRTEEELAALAVHVNEKAEEYARQAEQAARKGRFSQAEKLYNKALELDPTHAPSLAGEKSLAKKTNQAIAAKLKLAEEAFKKTDYPAAMKTYREILDIKPEHNQALLGLRSCRKALAAEIEAFVKDAEKALDNGDFEAAEDKLTLALAQDMYHKQALQLKQRLDLMQQAGAQPGDENKLYLQGVAYYTQGQYADAIKSWETVLLLNPAHDKSRQNITKTKRKMRQLKEYTGG